MLTAALAGAGQPVRAMRLVVWEAKPGVEPRFSLRWDPTDNPGVLPEAAREEAESHWPGTRFLAAEGAQGSQSVTAKGDLAAAS